MSRRTLLATLSGAAALTAAPVRRPNVVIFMTDDHGAWATGAYGAKDIHTPNIDALARTGVRFLNAFAATPVCSPSRMTYMTGTLPSTHGIQDWLMPISSYGEESKAWLDGLPAWAGHLHGAGYTMGFSGKWHMGNDATPQLGFSDWSTVPGGGGTYLSPEFVHNGQKVKPDRFKTDTVGDYALEFLEKQRGKQGPFCLFVPFYAPHTPFDATPAEYSDGYKDSTFPDYPDLPPRKGVELRLGQFIGNRAAKHGYSSLITAADANVGRVVRKLEEMGVRGETLVIFTADQGYNAGQHGIWGKGNGTRPFNMFEESIRVPMIWNHPAMTGKPRVEPAMVSSYDFFPTLLDYLHVPYRMLKTQPGQSYAGLLRGDGKVPKRDRLYFEYEYVRAVRTRNLKLVQRVEGYPSELYDLEADPGEDKDLIDDPQYAKQRKALEADLARFFAGIGAPPIEKWQSTVRHRLPELPR